MNCYTFDNSNTKIQNSIQIAYNLDILCRCMIVHVKNIYFLFVTLNSTAR